MAIDPEIKACTSCVHCHGHDDMFLECRRYQIGWVNYVHGTRWNDYTLCAVQRDVEGKCGPVGRGWEPKPAPAKPETSFSFRRWLGLL